MMGPAKLGKRAARTAGLLSVLREGQESLQGWQWMWTRPHGPRAPGATTEQGDHELSERPAAGRPFRQLL